MLRTDLPPAAVHLDLDGAAHIFRIHGWRYDEVGDPLFETGLTGALELFERAGVKATLFVIAEDLSQSRKRELVQEAVRRGHQVASHSLTHHRLTGASTATKRREIFDSRDRIAATLGVEPLGFRAPALALDRDCLELIDEAGYAYDSSLFPGPRILGRPSPAAADCRPYAPLAGRELRELPLPGYFPLPAPFHPSYSLVLGLWYFGLGLRWFRRRRAPLVLLFHLTDLAEPLPSDRLPHARARFFTLSHRSGSAKRLLCRRMLDAVGRHFELASTDELLRASRS